MKLITALLDDDDDDDSDFAGDSSVALDGLEFNLTSFGTVDVVEEVGLEDDDETRLNPADF